MDSCQPWLTCGDLKNFKIDRLIGVGAVKAVYLSFWNGKPVALSRLNNPEYKEDFDHGISMLKALNPSPLIVQLVGYCERENVIFTEYHKLGNATNIGALLAGRDGWEGVAQRLGLCINYAEILEFLHDGPIGTRVLCDSNDLMKLLSQFLLDEGFSLVLNDVDALPEVKKEGDKKIKCGHKQLDGDFVAPEQKWPYPGPFKDEAMPGYDEKTDIWKAADVCGHFFADDKSGLDWVHFRLFNLHSQCKSTDPSSRPSAKYLLSVYEKILAELLVKMEL